MSPHAHAGANSANSENAPDSAGVKGSAGAQGPAAPKPDAATLARGAGAAAHAQGVDTGPGASNPSTAVTLTKDLFKASRPISWINTAFPFGAAYLLAGGQPDLSFWVGCVFFLVPYNLAMYGINDVFDYESDLRNPRKGGIEGAVAAPATHHAILTAALVSCLPFVAYFVVVGSWAMVGVLALSLFAVAAYSVAGLRFKEIPVLDSVTSSVHFSSPAWFGLACVGVWPDGNGTLVLIAFLLWGIASQAFGAVQDVVPDRKGGLRSIATALGAKSTVQLSVLLYAAAGLCLGFAQWPIWLAAFLSLPYLAMTVRYWNVSDDDSARTNGGWKFFIGINYVVGFCTTVLMIVWKVFFGVGG